MNKKLFIVQKKDGAQVISTGVLTRALVAKLDESQVPYKRKDVISYAAGMVDGLNGVSITEDTYDGEIDLAVRVFQEFSKLTLISFRNMLLRLNQYDRDRTDGLKKGSDEGAKKGE